MSEACQMPILPIDIRGGCFKCGGKGWLKQILDGDMWSSISPVLCSCAQVRPREELKIEKDVSQL